MHSQPPKRPNQADCIAQALAGAGVSLAFGVPGGEVLTLIEALGAAGIRFVTSRHENAGGFMAEGVFRVDGAPAVLVATLGPGVANAVNVAAHALQDAVPLIILGGAVARAERPAYSHQVIDHLALFASVTKACFELNPEELGGDDLMAEALSVAQSDPPGSVYIDCAVDAVENEAGSLSGSKTLASQAEVGESRSLRSATKSADLELIRQRLENAERPLVLAGLHAMRPGVSQALASFAEAQHAFVMTSYKAKGLLSEDHANALGGVGLSPLADALVLPMLAASDFVLLLGYDPIEMRANWTHALPRNENLFELSDVPARPGLVYQPALRVSDPAASLQFLASSPVKSRRWPQGEPIEAQSQLKKTFRSRQGWEPLALFEMAQSKLRDRDYMLCVDTGAHRILLAQSWRLAQPGRLLHSTGFCTMACALPLAIGAKLRAPERDLVVVVGDGGLDMGLGELCTLRDLGLSIVVIVIDDQSLALIDMKQKDRGFVRSGVDLGPCDYAGVATALGGHGQLVENVDDFAEAFDSGLKRSGFTLIHAPFAKGIYDGRF